MRIYLTKSKGFVSMAIRFLSRSNTSHIAIEDITRKNIILQANALRKGLHFVSKYNFKKKNTIVDCFEFKIPEKGTSEYDKAKHAYLQLLNFLGNPYDTFAFVGFVLRYIIRYRKCKIKNRYGFSDALYCSEVFFIFIEYLISSGLIKENILKDSYRELFSPEDSYNLLKKETKHFKRVPEEKWF